VTPFDGDLEDYHRWLAERARDETRKARDTEAAGVSRKDQRRLEAQRRGKLQPFKDALKRIETDLGKLSASKAKVEEVLADVEIYGESNKKRLQDTLAEQVRLKQKIDELETRWMEASDALERAEKET
jgi:ATP-binding cassette subfamily F protein 3